MTRRLVTSFLALAILVLVVLELPLAISYQRTAQRDLTLRLERDAVALAAIADEPLSGPTTGPAGAAGRALVTRAARAEASRTGARVVVVSGVDGRAVVDTDDPADAPRNRSFASRPEVHDALAGKVRTGTRSSRTLGYRLLYVTVPASSGGTVHGAVRLTYPATEVDRRVRRERLLLVAIALVVLLATGLVGFVLARWAQRPLDDLHDAALRVGAGDLGATAPTEDGPPEVRELAHAFNDMVAQVRSLLESQRAFVADASHQLRTPLAALRLRIDNLAAAAADGAGAGPLDAVAIERAAREVDRLAALVDGLVALARADADATPDEHATVALDEAVAERIAHWEPLATERGIPLHAAVAPGDVRIARPLLDQVLDNLLDNALAATGEDGDGRVAGNDGISLTTRTTDDASTVELVVRDHGHGLAPGDHERAFDRFWTTRDQVGGSGLGLSIVRSLLAGAGGEVTLRTPGDGRGGAEAIVRLRRA